MARRLNRLILLILLIAPSAPVFAQSGTASLVGRVVDTNGAAVAGAHVSARDDASGAERQVRAGGDGTYRIERLTPGTYRVSADAPGFSTETRSVDVDKASTSVDLTLSPGTIAEEVTVTAARTERDATETPVPVTVVDRTELEQRNLNTIGDLFRDLPGVSTASEGPFQVRPRIRGLDSNRVLVLVDGERLNNARTSTSQSGIEIGLVDVDQVERVEVARGSGSVLYGTDALGGTINILTRDVPGRIDSGFRFGAGFNGFYSSNENGRRGSAYVTGTSTRFAFRIAQTLDRFEDYHSGPVPLANGGEDDSEAATTVANSAYHGSNTSLTGKVFINDFHSVKVSYERRRAADVGVPGVVGVFTAFFPFSNRDKVSGRYDGYDITDSLKRISASVYGQWQKRNFTNDLVVPPAPPFFPGVFQHSETITDTTSAGYDFQTTWALGGDNVLTAGTSFFRDRNQDERLIVSRDPDFSVFPPTLVETVDNSKSVPDATFANVAIFAQDELRATDWLRLVGGVRVDRFDIQSDRTAGFDLPPLFTPDQIQDLGLTSLNDGLSVDDTAVTGDIGVVVTPVEELSFTARVGRSFREPNLFELFFTDFGSVGGFVVANPVLDPESGVNVDVGVRYRSRSVAGSFTYFNNRYTDFLTSVSALDRTGAPIILNPGPGQEPIPVFRTVNTGRARIQGVEAELEGSITTPHSLISPFANVSYLRGDDLEFDEPLNFITPMKVTAGLRWQDRDGRFWSEYATRIVTTQDRLSDDFLISNAGPEAGFVTHDIRGGLNWRGERMTVGLTAAVSNLGNRYYSEQFTFAPARGRSATIGVSLRFE